MNIAAIRDFFNCDLKTGRVFWKRAHANTNKIIGCEAGCVHVGRNAKRYWIIQFEGKKIRRAKIVFLFATGIWPEMLDHIDGDGLNDIPSNLREANRLQNAWNRSARRKVSPLPMGIRKTASGRFQARVVRSGERFNLGTFASIEEAVCAYRNKRIELFGEFCGGVE